MDCQSGGPFDRSETCDPRWVDGFGSMYSPTRTALAAETSATTSASSARRLKTDQNGNHRHRPDPHQNAPSSIGRLAIAIARGKPGHVEMTDRA